MRGSSVVVPLIGADAGVGADPDAELLQLIQGCRRCHFYQLGHLDRRRWAEYRGLPCLIRPIRERVYLMANMGANSGPCVCGYSIEDPSALPPP